MSIENYEKEWESNYFVTYDGISFVLIMVFAAAIAFSLHTVSTTLIQWFSPDDAVFFVPPDPYMLGIAYLFLGIFLSMVPSTYILKRILKDNYDAYITYTKSLRGYYGSSTSFNWLAKLDAT